MCWPQPTLQLLQGVKAALEQVEGVPASGVGSVPGEALLDTPTAVLSRPCLYLACLREVDSDTVARSQTRVTPLKVKMCTPLLARHQRGCLTPQVLSSEDCTTRRTLYQCHSTSCYGRACGPGEGPGRPRLRRTRIPAYGAGAAHCTGSYACLLAFAQKRRADVRAALGAALMCGAVAAGLPAAGQLRAAARRLCDGAAAKGRPALRTRLWRARQQRAGCAQLWQLRRVLRRLPDTSDPQKRNL